jgi:uncharacterized protein YjiS (DUF1127 family)
MIRPRYIDLPIALRAVLCDLAGARLSMVPLTLQLWHRRLKLRHELARLDVAQIRDTGLDAVVVQREAVKPFWQA